MGPGFLRSLGALTPSPPSHTFFQAPFQLPKWKSGFCFRWLLRRSACVCVNKKKTPYDILEKLKQDSVSFLSSVGFWSLKRARTNVWKFYLSRIVVFLFSRRRDALFMWWKMRWFLVKRGDHGENQNFGKKSFGARENTLKKLSQENPQKWAENFW